MNSDTLKGKWTEIKGEIRKTWGKLTDDEVEQTKGDMGSIGGLIQQRYGLAKEDVSTRLNEIRDRYTESTKNSLRKSNDEAAKH